MTRHINVLVLLVTKNMSIFFRDYQKIAIYTAEQYIGEKDVIIIWISEEHGISNLANPQLLNVAVTRARKSLLICGANLMAYKVNRFLLAVQVAQVIKFRFCLNRIDRCGGHCWKMQTQGNVCSTSRC